MLKAVLSTLLVAVIIFFGGKHFIEKNNEATSSLPVATENIYLITERGDVFFRLPGDGDYTHTTSSPTIIPNQTTVKTEDGLASVLLPSQSVISLSTSTEIAVNYSKSGTNIFQSIGLTYHRVQKLLTGSTYEVQTPGTLAAVRGTKFAVSFHADKKETQVAVTENTVEVSKVKRDFDLHATTTARSEAGSQSILIAQGKIAKVKANVEKGESAIETMAIADADPELDTWVKVNQVIDKIYDDKVKNGGEGETKDRTLIEVLSHPPIDIKVKTNTTVKNTTTATTKNTTNTNTTNTGTSNTGNTGNNQAGTGATVNTTVNTTVTTPLSEEAFFDKFDTLFSDYFYIDDTDAICSINKTPDQKVKEVMDFASSNGRAFTSTTLLEFGQEIASYCKSAPRDPAIKLRLRARFDQEFPYRQ